MNHLNIHQKFIKEANRLAIESKASGNHPFGALVTYRGDILLRSENTVVTENDVTQHAELKLVSQISRSVSSEVIKECTLYTSTEPCAMCVGAIYWVGIRKVVFGLSARGLREFTSGSFITCSKSLFSYGSEAVSVTGPICEDECRSAHVGFW